MEEYRKQEYWNTIYSENEVIYSHIQNLWKYIVSHIYEPHTFKKVLDIGCGVGNSSLFFLDKGFQVDAFDFSQVAVERLNYQAQEYIQRGLLQLECSSFSHFTFQNNYDIMLALAALHFMKNQKEVEKYIEKMQKFTNRGGVHIISSPIYHRSNDVEFDFYINYQEIKKLYSRGWNIIIDVPRTTSLHSTTRYLFFILVAIKL